MTEHDPRLLAQALRTVHDFPRQGIPFRDITPLLADGRLLAMAVDMMAGPWNAGEIDRVVGIDARGFVFGAALALRLRAGFVPARKKGKLPYRTHEQDYQLEYGSATLAIHADALEPGQRVLLVDDLLATGGTARAAVDLIGRMEARIAEAVFLVELAALKGRERLAGQKIRSIIVE